MTDIHLDDDGFVDMDQFPDDGTDLAAADLAALRDVLRADPVDEPTPEAWDAMFDEAVTTAADGPFGLDDGLVADPFDGAGLEDRGDGSAIPADDALDPDGDEDGIADGGALGFDDGDGGDVDLDVDLDGVIDVNPDDVAATAYDVDGADVETPADISHDFEDTL